MDTFKTCFTTVRRILDPLLDLAIVVTVSVLVLDVLWGVATRFLLGEPSRWTEETAQYLLVWVAFLGASAAFRRSEHLGFDYLINHLEPHPRRVASIVSQIVTILFVIAVMVYGGSVLVFTTLLRDQVTPALQMKKAYVYLAVPLNGLFILAYQLEKLTGLLGGPEVMIDSEAEKKAIE